MTLQRVGAHGQQQQQQHPYNLWGAAASSASSTSAQAPGRSEQSRQLQQQQRSSEEQAARKWYLDQLHQGSSRSSDKHHSAQQQAYNQRLSVAAQSLGHSPHKRTHSTANNPPTLPGKISESFHTLSMRASYVFFYNSSNRLIKIKLF